MSKEHKASDKLESHVYNANRRPKHREQIDCSCDPSVISVQRNRVLVLHNDKKDDNMVAVLVNRTAKTRRVL
jgi:hypothetical protein